MNRNGSASWRHYDFRPVITILASLIFSNSASAELICDNRPFSPQFTDRRLFDEAINAASGRPRVRLSVAGLTVPHHLTAANLIARAFAAVQPEEFDKVVLLFPDHFRRARRPFASTTRPFETVFGPVCNSQADVARLLAATELVEESDLFQLDHGIGAVLPFVRHFLPDVPVIPVAVSITSRRNHWDELFAALQPIVTSRSLIVQSTDFSHYLSQGQAVLHDQTTLNLLAASDVDGIARLTQPAYLDSVASQYLHMRLQAGRTAGPIVLFNENSQAYSQVYEPETTSYVVQLYPREPVPHVLPSLPGSRVACFAGDTFIGRFLDPLLRDKRVAGALDARLQQILRGCPIIANLEGVFGKPGAAVRTDRKLVMNDALALAWLEKINVIAAGLANNHSHDLGDVGYRRTRAALRRARIRVLEHGRVADFGRFRVVALTDLNNASDPSIDRIGEPELEILGRSPAKPPLLAFVHWGEEFITQPGSREIELTTRLARSGVSLIVGTHPHARSDRLTSLFGGESLLAYSLGNFLFDQPEPRSSGALLELRLFDQGTFFARLVPIPNFFGEALRPRLGR